MRQNENHALAATKERNENIFVQGTGFSFCDVVLVAKAVQTAEAKLQVK